MSAGAGSERAAIGRIGRRLAAAAPHGSRRRRCLRDLAIGASLGAAKAVLLVLIARQLLA